VSCNRLPPLGLAVKDCPGLSKLNFVLRKVLEGYILNQNKSTPTISVKRCSTVVLLALCLAGLSTALPPAQAKSVIEQASRTWMPSFKINQTIYVDSKIRNHPKAPFQFSADFSKKLALYGKLTDLKYFVVTAQQGTETIPSGTKLGTAKIDELLPSWSSASGFPLQNYVAIFWVRRSDDPTKGSIGVNVGSKVRDLGVTPEALSAQDGLVLPELKRYMPQDPENSLLSIAQNINDKVLSTRQAQLLNQPQQAQSSQDVLKQLSGQMAISQNINDKVPTTLQEQLTQREDSSPPFPRDVLEYLLLLLAGGGASSICFLVFRDRKAKKLKAEALKHRWKVVTENGAALYTELTENYFSKLEYISSLKLDGIFATQAEQARMSLANFIAHWTEAEKRSSLAGAALEQKKYGQVVRLLKHEPIKVTGEALPIKVATLLGGLTPTHEYSPDKLISSMSRLYEDARDKTLELIEAYEGAAQFQNGQPQKITEAVALVKQKLETPFEYGLAIATAPAEPQKTLFDPAQTSEFFAKIAEQIRLGVEAWSNNNLNEAIGLYDSIAQLLAEREGQIDKAIAEKLRCDKLSVEVDEALDVTYQHVQAKEELAKISLEKVQVSFPSEDISVHIKKLHEVREIFIWVKTQFKDVQRLYLASQFDRAIKTLTTVMAFLVEHRAPLDDLIQLPETMADRQQVLSKQLVRYQSHPSRFGTVSQGTDFEVLENMLLLGQLTSVQSQLDSIEAAQAVNDSHSSLSSSYWNSTSDYGSSSDSSNSSSSDSSNSSSSDSSYDSSSSSSSYDSSSSSSDYSSSSSSSDYGSSSGGGDY
jgi:hypothetical protein